MLSVAEMAQFSRLLDSALELDLVGRQSWLNSLSPEYQHLLPALRRALLPAGAESAKHEPISDLGPETLVNAIAGALACGDMVGPYRLVRPLGAGGMAEVWLAERADGAFRREVALKLPMLFRIRSELAVRFERERDILAALVHPNIARLYDAGVSRDGLPYIAMEYVVGTPVTEHCDNQRLSVRARLELFLQILGAVRYAHANLVIHRDIKPSNVLVTKAGQVQLLDFGIAKILNEGEAKETKLTAVGGRVLTPDYAAPEQITGAPITTATDIYALGVVLYELLTGRRPYRLEHESLGALEQAILHAEPVPPSRLTVTASTAQARATTVRKLRKELDGDLSSITLRALKKATSKRYESASEFAEDIGRFLRGETVLAQPDSAAYRLRKFVGRHRFAIGAIGTLIITLAVGLATTAYEAHAAAAQRDSALQAQRRSLTQTAAARLREADVAGALSTIVGSQQLPYTQDALAVFQEARASDVQILALAGHTAWVMSVAFSPDGRRMVTGSSDNTARVWDSTGRLLRVLPGHSDRVRGVTFSPDGRVIATASYDKTIRLWDAESGEQLQVLSGHTDRIRSISYSPDGRSIVTGSYDQTAVIWDVASGQKLRVLKGHTDVVSGVAFSPDGRQVVTASGDRTARLWDAVSGVQLRTLNGHADFVNSAAFSPDGLHVVTASDDATARIWEVATGRQLLALRGHSGFVASAAYSPDGLSIVTASFDKTARIWDASSGMQLRLLRGHRSGLESAVYSLDGGRILTASLDHTARVWSAGKPPFSFGGHTDALTAVQFSPDGTRILTASIDETARIWDSANGKQLRILRGHTDRVEAASFSPDGGRVATASWDRTGGVWNAASGERLLTLRGHEERLEGIAYSSDGGRLVTGARDGTVRIWDAATGEQIRVLTADGEHIPSPQFSPDGKHIVGAASDGTVRIWVTDNGQQVLVLRGHSDFVSTASYSPDGRRIVTASNDNTARIWDSGGKELLVLSGHTDRVVSASFSHDGRFVVTASWDKSARIWDSTTGALLQIVNGHGAPLEGAAFSPDGLRIVTASDQQAPLWVVHAPSVAIQVAWAEAAEFDPLTSKERFQLGLRDVAGVRQWPAGAVECDELAAAPYDPLRRASGVMEISQDAASQACKSAEGGSDRPGRLLYQRGRVLMSGGDLVGAARNFERALALGYPAAAVDLARLLSRPSVKMLDVARAVSLYEKAWTQGVTIAAFELGGLYERGVRQDGRTDAYLLNRDNALAWNWYHKGSEQGEPNSLARFGEKEDEDAAASRTDYERNAHLVQAFRNYAAASERARLEAWPDDAWSEWRYRRAAIARQLADAGMVERVAAEYNSTRKRYAPAEAAWHRLGSIFSTDLE
jgi:WD40 repeat protein/serine/threonine protein kinase